MKRIIIAMILILGLGACGGGGGSSSATQTTVTTAHHVSGPYCDEQFTKYLESMERLNTLLKAASVPASNAQGAEIIKSGQQIVDRFTPVVGECAWHDSETQPALFADMETALTKLQAHTDDMKARYGD